MLLKDANPGLLILGAGMAGLLAANMLRRFNPLIIERADALPHNHSALLRFRTTAVSDATGIPFSHVRVNKGIWNGTEVLGQCSIPLANAYSQRVAGKVEDRSIWNLAPETRWIAPPDFVEQMAGPCSMIFSTDAAGLFDHDCPFAYAVNKEMPVISTLPLPALLKTLDKNRMTVPAIEPAEATPIATIRMRILSPVVDVHQTVYNGARPIKCQTMGPESEPRTAVFSEEPSWYRLTIQGDEVICELMDGAGSDFKHSLNAVIYKVFGIWVRASSPPSFHYRKLGKIGAINEDQRQRAIYELTTNHNIYSLGRFATWRPGLLLDDLVNDIRVIERLITAGSYQRNLQAVKK